MVVVIGVNYPLRASLLSNCADVFLSSFLAYASVMLVYVLISTTIYFLKARDGYLDSAVWRMGGSINIACSVWIIFALALKLVVSKEVFIVIGIISVILLLLLVPINAILSFRAATDKV